MITSKWFAIVYSVVIHSVLVIGGGEIPSFLQQVTSLELSFCLLFTIQWWVKFPCNSKIQFN